jgi:hypothetical protein
MTHPRCHSYTVCTFPESRENKGFQIACFRSWRNAVLYWDISVSVSDWIHWFGPCLFYYFLDTLLREFSLLFTSLTPGKTGWVSWDHDAGLADWLALLFACPCVCEQALLNLAIVRIEKQHPWLCIREKVGVGVKRNFLSNPCGARIGHGQASEGVQLSNEPSVKGDLCTSWNEACSAPLSPTGNSFLWLPLYPMKQTLDAVLSSDTVLVHTTETALNCSHGLK